ncbi:tripartite tricarboxylate transporter TctB family protein [Propylenella binzhouense]|uniref:Tripartite tricarboxylate transporter TctB family protein n=1 Tax=Propylenella binzhouense TaxID=2555902 RepID=A0A964T7N1_9HYPH|nr:tripartite tricarboxylate transporter TctB family protein [Propylenella binzhouense]MYZ49944.1 tripartite tricarboxylate transporter TctB family protein [Propylenella binzhouense]
MKRVFILAILALALGYTYFAFELSFLSSTGRLGPGFFPRVIGLGLIASCLYALAVEWRSGGTEAQERGLWGVAVRTALLSGLFVALLNVLGGLVAMIVFMLAALFMLNPGRVLQNLAVAFLLPIGIYVLFEFWLNAGIPQGMLPLPV